jgi:hypothetical protein
MPCTAYHAEYEQASAALAHAGQTTRHSIDLIGLDWAHHCFGGLEVGDGVFGRRHDAVVCRALGVSV